ncbi:MAG TPA: hypothetical protein DDX40_01540 [Rikenellaceae bacterium]|nr:hypothetical protein [Rikenellaceae bacterium]
MPLNKNAMARYHRLDACFRDRSKMYYIEDLIRECSDAIRTSDDSEATVSRSQVFADIKNLMYEYPGAIVKMRGERGRVCYRYADPGFSINNRPLSVDEAKMIRDTIMMLGRFKGLPYFDKLEDAAKRFEEFGLTSGNYDCVGFESNEDLVGLDNFDGLFNAIVDRHVLKIRYSPAFDKEEDRIFHPYYLKQYNCRWFLLGFDVKVQAIRNFALDRIKGFSVMNEIEYVPYEGGGFEEYFKDVVGVTIMENEPVQDIEFLVYDEKTFNYLTTNPFHPSLKILKGYSQEEPARMSVTVRPNFELEAVLLRYADNIRIISPEPFRQRFVDRARKILERNE